MATADSASGGFVGKSSPCYVGKVGVLLAKALAIAVISVGPAAPCNGVGACAYPPNHIYIATQWWSGTADAYVAYDPADRLNTRNHELGHIVDYNLLTDQDRGMFQAIMHRKGEWRQAVNSPHEQFAEAFRLCAISTRYVSRHQGLGFGYNPTLFQHRKVCRWLATIGARP